MANKIKVGIEREIKFDEKLRYDRQKDYNINDYEYVEADFADAGHKRVYKNFNFSIFIDKHCNADCKFCVAQLRYENMKALYNKNSINDSSKYLERLDEILQKIRPLNPSVSITGGEPTISPILTDVLKLIDKYGFRKRTITTNGSGLFNIQDGDTILNNLIKYNWDYLNISRASYDDAKNRQIMRFQTEGAYCTMDMVRRIIKETQNTRLKHRISCLLLKESVNSVAEIKKYVDFYSDLGADNFIFRELMDYDHLAVNKEKVHYCDTNKVKLNEIWEDFAQYPEFKKYLNILGYYYYVEIYKMNKNGRDITIASESADLNQQYKEKEKNPDMVYEMVFHDNGNLNASWVDYIEVLDRAKI